MTSFSHPLTQHVIWESTFSDNISAVSKSCLYYIPDLSRIRNTIDQTTACTIATSLVHSKLDYCNSLLLNLPAAQTNRLQLILMSAAHAVTKTPKFHNITPILKSLHWININEEFSIKFFLSHTKHLAQVARHISTHLSI